MFLQFMPASPGYMCHQAFLQLVPQPAAAICVDAQVKWSYEPRYEKETFSHDGLGLGGSSEKWQGGESSGLSRPDLFSFCLNLEETLKS